MANETRVLNNPGEVVVELDARLIDTQLLMPRLASILHRGLLGHLPNNNPIQRGEGETWKSSYSSSSTG